MLRPAIFLDRDGTLIEDRGYLTQAGQIEMFPGTLAALQSLREHFVFVIVTNQSGVAGGMLSMADVDRVNSALVAELERHGIEILSVYVCPHRRADNCECIKPKPYFVRRAAEQFGLDLERSFAIGDHPHDVELATGVGARGVFVRTGHGARHVGELPAGTVVVDGIAQAAQWILDHLDPSTPAKCDRP